MKIQQYLSSKNVEAIRQIVSTVTNPVILVVFGDIIMKRKYLRDCFRDIVESCLPFNSQWIIWYLITNHKVKYFTLRRQYLKHGYDRSPLRLQHRLIERPGDISWATNLPIPKSYFPPIRNLLSIYLFNSCIIGYSINRFMASIRKNDTTLFYVTFKIGIVI